MLPDSPEKEAIEKLLSGPPGLACFDFDNTLIRGDLGEAVMYYILLQGLIAADTDLFWSELQHPAIPAAAVETWKRLWEIYRDQEDAFSYEKIAEGLLESEAGLPSIRSHDSCSETA